MRERKKKSSRMFRCSLLATPSASTLYAYARHIAKKERR